MAGRVVVALVDDDESIREGVGSLLRSAGFDVSAWASAEEFLQAAHPLRAGCLIVDVQLPGMDGFELLQRLMSDGYRVPAIFLTDHAGRDEWARAMEAGAQAFLPKPFDAETLVRTVRCALGAEDR
jgi:FixJ family two-component response regulator